MHTQDPLHVVFGFGPIGRALVEQLAAAGARVRLVTRSGARPQGLSRDVDVEVVAGDAARDESAIAACAGATTVYNCTSPRDYHRWPTEFPPLQRGVLAGARAAGAVLVVVENLYVYGPHDGAPMTEDMPLRGQGLRSSTRVAMTKELDAATDLPIVRVRASDLIGRAVKESMAGDRLMKPILAGDETVRILGDADVPHSVTAVSDVARALIVLGADPRAHGKAWHVPSVTVTPRELVRTIAAAAGRQAPDVRGTPRALLSMLLPVLGLFVPPMRGISENLYMFTEPFVVDGGAVTRTFGLQATPLEQTAQEAVEFLNAAPRIAEA